MQFPSLSHDRLRGFCLAGTFNPSRRQMRCTRFAHQPARLLLQCSDAPIAIAALLTRQRDDRLRQPVFIVAVGGLITPRGVRLAHQTGTPAVHSILFPERGARQSGAAPDLEVSLRNILQDLFFDGEIGDGAPELGIFALRIRRRSLKKGQPVGVKPVGRT